jgi:hypothetical protein
MFSFLKNLFKPKDTDKPHPLDGPVRAANEKAALPKPVEVQLPAENTITVTEPAKATVTVSIPEAKVEAVAPQPAPLKPAEKWPFPTSAPVEPPAVPVVEFKEKKPRKPRAPKQLHPIQQEASRTVIRKSKKK